MKLKTLVEVQQCFDLLRTAEQDGKPLSSTDYVRCLSAKSVFGWELKQHMDAMPEIEVTDWSAA